MILSIFHTQAVIYSTKEEWSRTDMGFGHLFEKEVWVIEPKIAFIAVLCRTKGVNSTTFFIIQLNLAL